MLKSTLYTSESTTIILNGTDVIEVFSSSTGTGTVTVNSESPVSVGNNDSQYYGPYSEGATIAISCTASKIDVITYTPIVQIDSCNIRTLNSIRDLCRRGDRSGIFNILSYHIGDYTNGGIWYYDAERRKSLHDAISIIDPDRPFPPIYSDATQLSAWQTANDVGSGCFIRLLSY